MTGFSFLFIILLALSFVVFFCKGQINLPPGGKTLYFVPGSDARIEWSFTSTGIIARAWFFIKADGSRETLGSISGENGDPVKKKSSIQVDIEKPATLILRNVNITYNGTYQFSLTANPPDISDVTVFIAMAPNVTVNCSSSVEVDEGKTVICECRAEDGNPPSNVTWLRKSVPFVGPKKIQNTLVIRGVDKDRDGDYTCVAQSHTLTVVKSVKVIVYYKPVNTKISINPESAILNKKVVVTCEAEGLPEPSYEIFRNGSLVKKDKTHTIDAVNKSDAGPYSCVATNRLGSTPSTNDKTLSVKEKGSVSVSISISPSPPTTIATSTSSLNKPDTVGTAPAGGNGNGGMSVGAIVGIVIGVLVLLVIIFVVVWWCKSKEKRGYGGNVNPSSGEERLDNAYESIESNKKASGANREDNPYASPDEGAYDNTSGSPSAEPSSSTPAVYAQVNKPKKAEPPSVTYATLDTMAMQPSIKRANDGGRQPQTEYASINFKDLKGDLV